MNALMPEFVIITHITKELARKAEIANDHFVRTTDREHKEAVQYAWVKTCREIFESKVN